MSDFFSDLDALRVEPGCSREPKPIPRTVSNFSANRIQGEFLKGPITLAWLTPAVKLSGKAPLSVSLALWFEAGRTRSLHDLALTSALLKRFGVSRKAKYRGLKALEDAGLVQVKKRERRNPLITIIEQPNEATGSL